MVLNYIWIGFFLIAFLIASVQLFVFGNYTIFKDLVDASFTSSKTAFELAIGLTGAMAMWLGFMKIGEKAGIVKILTFVFGPFFKRLFPEIPQNHPAITPIFMKLSANFLGLDNAGTPLGIKAMKEMQTLNPTPEVASNAQIMFAVLNTTGMTFIPITILAYRVQYQAHNPANVFIPILLSTSIAFFSALIITAIIQKINLLDKVLLTYLLALIGIITATIAYFSTIPLERVSSISGAVSNFSLFSIIIFFMVLATVKKISVYEAFIEGAKEGFETAVRIIPFLVCFLVGIAVFRASGALTFLLNGIESVTDYFGITGEYIYALPVALLKPLSGSGAQAAMIDVIKNFGPDSLMGQLACVFQGTTDTTLYILAVYFGAVNIKKTRYAAGVGLIASFIGMISAIFVTYIFFFRD
jgi:spore maturation protein SpmA